MEAIGAAVLGDGRLCVWCLFSRWGWRWLQSAKLLLEYCKQQPGDVVEDLKCRYRRMARG